MHTQHSALPYSFFFFFINENLLLPPTLFIYSSFLRSLNLTTLLCWIYRVAIRIHSVKKVSSNDAKASGMSGNREGQGRY